MSKLSYKVELPQFGSTNHSDQSNQSHCRRDADLHDGADGSRMGSCSSEFRNTSVGPQQQALD